MNASIGGSTSPQPHANQAQDDPRPQYRGDGPHAEHPVGQIDGPVPVQLRLDEVHGIEQPRVVVALLLELVEEPLDRPLVRVVRLDSVHEQPVQRAPVPVGEVRPLGDEDVDELRIQADNDVDAVEARGSIAPPPVEELLSLAGVVKVVRLGVDLRDALQGDYGQVRAESLLDVLDLRSAFSIASGLKRWASSMTRSTER